MATQSGTSSATENSSWFYRTSTEAIWNDIGWTYSPTYTYTPYQPVKTDPGIFCDLPIENRKPKEENDKMNGTLIKIAEKLGYDMATLAKAAKIMEATDWKDRLIYFLLLEFAKGHDYLDLGYKREKEE